MGTLEDFRKKYVALQVSLDKFFEKKALVWAIVFFLIASLLWMTLSILSVYDYNPRLVSFAMEAFPQTINNLVIARLVWIILLLCAVLILQNPVFEKFLVWAPNSDKTGRAYAKISLSETLRACSRLLLGLTVVLVITSYFTSLLAISGSGLDSLVSKVGLAATEVIILIVCCYYVLKGIQNQILRQISVLLICLLIITGGTNPLKLNLTTSTAYDISTKNNGDGSFTIEYTKTVSELIGSKRYECSVGFPSGWQIASGNETSQHYSDGEPELLVYKTSLWNTSAEEYVDFLDSPITVIDKISGSAENSGMGSQLSKDQTAVVFDMPFLKYDGTFEHSTRLEFLDLTMVWFRYVSPPGKDRDFNYILNNINCNNK